MKIEQFKTWLEGFGEAAGLTSEQIKCIYDKVMLIKGIEDHVRKESMQNLEFDISKSYLSPEEIELIKNYPKVNLSELEKAPHLQCLHPPGGVCSSCGTVPASYSSGSWSDNPLSMHYKAKLLGDPE